MLKMSVMYVEEHERVDLTPPGACFHEDRKKRRFNLMVFCAVSTTIYLGLSAGVAAYW
jgi:hypothetical protein